MNIFVGGPNYDFKNVFSIFFLLPTINLDFRRIFAGPKGDYKFDYKSGFFKKF